MLQKAGLVTSQPPSNTDELLAMVKQLFVTYENLDEILRATALSEQAYELRKEVLLL